MSDLHLEMHADRVAEFIRELDPTGVDVLVLAGDITMARDYEDLETELNKRSKPALHPRDFIDIQSFLWVVGADDSTNG